MTKSRLDHPLVRAAIRIAEVAHAGGGRHSPGTAYLAHYRRVTEIVSTLDSVNEIDVAAAMLLGVLNDTPVGAVELTGRLLNGGANAAVAGTVVGLVTEVTEGLRCEKKLASASDRAKRVMLCDRIVRLTGGVVPDDMLPGYLAACDVVVDLAGDADVLLAGWLIHEVNKRRNPNQQGN